MAYGYRYSEQPEVEAARARQRAMMENERQEWTKLREKEGRVRSTDRLATASTWLRGFTPGDERDLPLAITATRWFYSAGDARDEAMLEAIAQNERRIQRLEASQQESEQRERDQARIIDALRHQLDRHIRQVQQDAQTILRLRESIGGLRDQVRRIEPLENINAELRAENEHLRRQLAVSPGNRVNVQHLQEQVRRLEEINQTLHTTITKLHRENAQQVRGLSDARNNQRPQQQPNQRRSSLRGDNPPTSFPDRTSRGRSNGQSPARSRRSSESSRSSSRRGWSSSETQVDDTSSDRRRRDSSSSSRVRSTSESSRVSAGAPNRRRSRPQQQYAPDYSEPLEQYEDYHSPERQKPNQHQTASGQPVTRGRRRRGSEYVTIALDVITFCRWRSISRDRAGKR